MRRLAALLLAVAAAVAPAVAPAQPADAKDAAGQALVLVAESLPPALDLERVRAALEQDLGRPVRIAAALGAGAGVVLSSRAAGEVIVRYRAEDGRDDERALALPAAAAEAIESVALVASNLVRDEASALAAALRLARPAAHAPPPPPPAPEGSRPPRGPAAPPRAPPASPCRGGPGWLPVAADFLPFVGTSSAFGLQRTRGLALNVLGGVGEAVVGAEIGGVFNASTRSLCGAQLAGVVNVVAGPVVGAQVAGALNLAARVEGVQLGAIDVAWGPVRGAQLGAIDVAGPVTGAQLGALALSAGRVEGAQLAAVNVAARGLRGLQIGATNVAGGSSEGAQLGAINVAGDLAGLQLGVINVAAGEVRGAQLGVVNVARRSTLSLGLVNVVPGSRVHVDVWGTETGSVLLGLEHGGKHAHTILAAGVRPDELRSEWIAGAGLGGHAPLPHGLHVDVDALAYALVPSVAPEDVSLLAQARVLVGWAPVRGFALFAGPTFNLLFTEDAGRPTRSRLPSWIVDEEQAGWTLRSLWPGATLGVRIL